FFSTPAAKVPLPELHKQVQAEGQSDKASAVRVRAGTQIQVPLLQLPEQENLSYLFTYTDKAYQLSNLRTSVELAGAKSRESGVLIVLTNRGTIPTVSSHAVDELVRAEVSEKGLRKWEIYYQKLREISVSEVSEELLIKERCYCPL
ncbi:GSCOCG00002824001-RA-CDS, partial [Cotesia congregata]